MIQIKCAEKNREKNVYRRNESTRIGSEQQKSVANATRQWHKGNESGSRKKKQPINCTVDGMAMKCNDNDLIKT